MSIDDARRDEARAAKARRMGIPEWQLQMAEDVGTAVIQDLVADAHRTGLPTIPSEPVRGSGWTDQVPLKPPEGINYVDRLCDAADRQDKLDRLAAEMKQRERLAALAPREAKPDPTGISETPVAKAPTGTL
jgi:hypothetical protein